LDLFFSDLHAILLICCDFDTTSTHRKEVYCDYWY